MEATHYQNSDTIFDDKKYWTPARRKLLLTIFEGSSIWDRKELGEKIGKNENTVWRYLREGPFQQAMLKMTALLQLKYAIRTLQLKEALFDRMTKETIKRVEKMRLKGILRIIKAIEKDSQETFLGISQGSIRRERQILDQLISRVGELPHQ